MKKRSPATVVLLTLLTFGLYAYYWLYTTTQELREQTGRKDLSPALDVMLTMVTLGLWGIYAGYRNASLVHEQLLARGQRHEDRSIWVALVGAATYFTGGAWLVAMALLQEEYNRLAERPDFFASVAPYREAGGSVGSAAGSYLDEPFDAAPPKVRVQASSAASRPRGPRVEPSLGELAEHPIEHPVEADGAPAAPVFLSDAPAPIVY